MALQLGEAPIAYLVSRGCVHYFLLQSAGASDDCLHVGPKEVAICKGGFDLSPGI